jgi:hypothetical protein
MKTLINNEITELAVITLLLALGMMFFFGGI